MNARAPRHLTVRNLPEELGRALRKETRRRGTSLNQTVIDLLGRGLGVIVPSRRRTNGLRHLAGTWTAEEHGEFLRALQPIETVDEEMWR
jgi:hypothetical protein